MHGFVLAEAGGYGVLVLEIRKLRSFHLEKFSNVPNSDVFFIFINPHIPSQVKRDHSKSSSRFHAPSSIVLEKG